MPKLIKFFLLLCTAIGTTILLTWPFVTKLATYYSDIGDLPLTGWVLWHNQLAIRTGTIFNQQAYFQSNQFYPMPLSLAYSDHSFIETFLFAPLFWITQHLIFSINFSVFVAFILTFISMYYVSFFFTKNTVASIFSAIIYTFNPFMYAHWNAGHIFLLHRYFLPLLFLSAYQYFLKPDYKRSFLFFLFFTLNALTVTYFFIMTTTICIFILPILTSCGSLGKQKEYWTTFLKTSLIGLCFLPLLGYFTLPYVTFSQKEGAVRTLSENIYFSARPLDWFLSTPDSLLYGKLSQTMEPIRMREEQSNSFNYGEHTLFLNIVPIMLMLSGFLFFIQKLKKYTITKENIYFFIIFTTIFVLSYLLMSPDGFSLAYPLIPLLKGIRVPTRFEFILYIPFSLFVAYGIIFLQKYKKIYPFLIALLAILLFLENIHVKSYAETSPTIQKIQKDPKSNAYLSLVKHSNTLHVPITLNPVGAVSQYLNWSTFTQENIVNGYSGFYPEDWIYFLIPLDKKLDEPAFKKLLAIDVHYIIFHKNLLNAPAMKMYHSMYPLYAKGKVFEDDELLIVDLRKYHYTIPFCNISKNFSLIPKSQKLLTSQEQFTFKNNANCYLPSLFQNRYRSLSYYSNGKHYKISTTLPPVISPFEAVIITGNAERK